MLSKILSSTTIGLDGVTIKVEVDVAERGFPTFTIVGLASKAVEESKERVRTAIYNSGFEIPSNKIVINLAPADIPKEGALFDLPIAIGILASCGVIDRKSIDQSMFVGELSLDGKINSVNGVLPVTIHAKKIKVKNLYIPQDNYQEAALVDKVTIYPINNLIQLILHLNNQQKLSPAKKISWKQLLKKETYKIDFADVKGQQIAKRALMIASAGGHNLHMKGPPGVGKTMLARAFPSILPQMDEEEIIEVSKIYSVSHVYQNKNFVICRPFRAPHHTISRVGIVGGGAKLNPGEVSLAHRGVLFLDEFPEFPRSVLEALRQPLEDGIVTITRAVGSVTFPARFILIAASNPCPCGYLGHPKKSCKCSIGQILKYKKKISGPLLDRIDIHIDVLPVNISDLKSQNNILTSLKIREIITRARAIQQQRFKKSSIKTNSEMTPVEIKKYCLITKQALEVLKLAFSRLSLSARSYFKLIKIAQTIADLKADNKITSSYISEAIQYRAKEE